MNVAGTLSSCPPCAICQQWAHATELPVASHFALYTTLHPNRGNKGQSMSRLHTVPPGGGGLAFVCTTNTRGHTVSTRLPSWTRCLPIQHTHTQSSPLTFPSLFNHLSFHLLYSSTSPCPHLTARPPWMRSELAARVSGARLSSTRELATQAMYI